MPELPLKGSTALARILKEIKKTPQKKGKFIVWKPKTFVPIMVEFLKENEIKMSSRATKNGFIGKLI